MGNRSKFMDAHQAVRYIPDGATMVVDGFLMACLPEEIVLAIAESYEKMGRPKGLTLVHSAGQGDGKGRGIDRLSKKGLLKRSIGGHWNLIPSLQKSAIHGDMEGYNFPQGVIAHMIRDAVSKRPGTLTPIGLHTFVDPRQQGGKVNEAAKEDLVKLIECNGEECLFYAPLHIDVALIRGTVADYNGNISMEEEPLLSSALHCAQAAHNNGGVVIAQVKRVEEDGCLSPERIDVPGIYVDIVVPVEDENHHNQADGYFFDSSLCGMRGTNEKEQGQNRESMPLDERKIIARRAIRELEKGAVANLGIGMPEGVALVAKEEGRLQDFTLTVESGLIGGMPLSGTAFGCARHYEARIDAAAQFDFYQGGGLNIAFLGLAQADRRGNVNVSRFGTRIAGCGGFIDITQYTKKVVFCGTFTAKGLKTSCVDGKLHIDCEGEVKKFVRDVEQITFSGAFAGGRGADVLYVTERAVFSLTKEGLSLIEYAPGIDIERDILAYMDFQPIIDSPVEMDAALFQE
ncbi:acyl CoA:acetate/3-ketoacid CoA transferase [Christensenellaceae bacterium OttesenSCG-928-M15]|nr:acyl CoA:acetate/3-ketoacid CoA transferase [Christensenellaceae bacterium OttesenSCG-928-M15]